MYLKFTIYTLLFLSFFACSKQQTTSEIQSLSHFPESISLDRKAPKGLLILERQVLQPNAKGIIAETQLSLPPFQQGVYYRPFSEKVAAGNRVEPLWFRQISQLDSLAKLKPRFDDFINLGAFILLKKEDGNYLALLPLVSNRMGNTFSIRGNSLYLSTATYGTQREDLAVPLISYAESESPYEATRQAWELAMEADGIKGNINWRSSKTYPEAYAYLGWCSWEHYRQKISEKIILNAIREIKATDIPFRWVLVDDGYLHQEHGKLLSFGVDKKKFPNGWDAITSQKDDKLKWMGIWRNFNGYMGGVSTQHQMPNLQEHLALRKQNKKYKRYMPKISEEAAYAFYHEMTADTKANGFDLIKVDFQSNNFRYNTGSKNAILGVHYNNTALEENCKNKNLQLLNCIAQQNFNVFNHRYSALIRGSIDYKTTQDRLDLTLVQNFANALWLGHTHWLDQDMFFANHNETARLMAVARAISGGPVYLSDEPQNIDDAVLKPLTFSDGHILSTLAPGVPLPESVMQDPYYAGKAYRVIAPLENNAAAIMAVNLSQNNQVVSSYISQNDYPYAGGMVQPYNGLWKIPNEGLLLYDQYAQTASVLADDYSFNLNTRKERLFQLSPIQHGWSLIGRPDKYLPAACFKLLAIDEKTITIKLVEDGPFLLWSASKSPQSESFEFTSLENGLWRGELIRPNSKREYTIEAAQ